MKLLFIIIRSIIYVPLFILLFGWIALNVRGFDRQIGLVLPLWARPIGIILMAFGGILVLICVAVFIIKGKGTPAVFDPPTEFVATGPYAYVRNPMYIGGFVLLTGFGLYHTSISIVILSVILIGLFHLFVVFVEEPSLEKLFGKSYLEYKKQVNRWIPKFK
jgi:protein-S-isoprenylcysteine O-methyltransferase Ste14